MIKRIHTQIGLLVAILAIGSTVTISAAPLTMQPHIKSDAMLFDSIIAMGGGAQHFRAARLRRELEGGSTEDARLRNEVGDDMVHRFDRIFTKVVKFEISHYPPTTSSTLVHSPTKLASDLYQDGMTMGRFNVEHLYDRLFSSQGHAMAMSYVATNFGATNQKAWHKVFAQLLEDRVAQ